MNTDYEYLILILKYSNQILLYVVQSFINKLEIAFFPLKYFVFPS